MSSPAEYSGPGKAQNRSRLESRLIVAILSLFLAMPLGFILLAVRYGPAAEAEGPPLFGGYVLPLALASIILGAAAFRLVFAAFRMSLFFVALSSTIAGLVVASVALGSLAHRDFFTAAFQYLLGALIAVMYRLASRPRSSLNLSQASLRGLSRAGFVVSIFYVEWIMLMGYAISTRAEPRPVESILYNIYDLAQVLILYVTSRWVERNAFHTARMEGEALDVDGRDILPVLGQKKAAIFRGFALAPDRRLRCSDIQALFQDESGETAPGPCADCTERSTKVALCARYRNTYNSILELKRVLEFLEIGTITAPENKRHILSDGWKLVLFENARLVVRKK
jgi:hypothetical protein